MGTTQGSEHAQRIFDRLTDTTVGVATLLLIGGAGLGKTHHLHRLATLVRSAGGRVAWCQCNQALGGLPLWEWRAAISELDPEISAKFPGADSLEAFQGLWHWLERSGGDTPTLVVLDDLHDASRSTVQLFDQLGRRPRTTPWLVVASTRSALGQMSAARVVLDGVDAEEALSMAVSLGFALTIDEANELVHFTGGNPLFIRRILESGVEGLEMTPELLSFISASIGELAAEIQPVAEALSVLGTSAERSTLQLVVAPEGWPSSLISGNTLEVEDDQVSFRHPLLREVIYEQLADDRRSQLHARAAHVIQQTGGTASLAAVHWGRASMSAQGPMAADTALRAGHLALDMGMWTDAVGHFSHAGAVLEQLNDLGDRAASGAYRARALSMGGDIGAALRVILKCAHLVESTSEVTLATRQLLARELFRLRWREEPNPSILDPATLTRTVDSLLGSETDPISRAMVAVVAVVAGEIGGLTESTAAIMKQAAVELSPISGPVVRGEALLSLRRALMAVPDSLQERLQASKEAVAASRESEDLELTGRSLRMLLTDAMAAGDRPLVLSTIAAFDTAATTALREHQALSQAGLAALEGRYDDATEILDLAAKELSYVRREAPALEFAHAMVAFDRGGFSEVLAQYEPVLAVVGDASLRASFAYIAATEGNIERATELVDGALELFAADEYDPLRRVSLAMAAETSIIIGHAATGQLLDLLTPLEGSCLNPANASLPWLGSADRLIGLLKATVGDLEGAELGLRSSLTVHRSMQADPWSARSLVGLAAVQRALGRPDKAAACELEAAAIVDRLGMAPIPVPAFGRVSDVGVGGSAQRKAAERRVQLERTKRGWLLRLEGETGHALASLVGLGQLALLLSEPGREWHVLDLVAAAAGSGPAGSHAGEVLDDVARRTYQERMAVLRADLEEAERRADLEQVSRLRLEIDAIESELLAAFGLGGRGRRMGDEAERARINTRRNLNRAILTIEQSVPMLGDHLRHRVVTGRFCTYRPSVSDPIVWEVVL